MSILKHKFPPDLSSIYNEDLANQLAQTQGAISALNQLNHLLLNPDLLMRPILGKEAESSAQLEGTQASLEDAYQIQIGSPVPQRQNDALEIRNYEEAMLTTRELVRKHGLNEAVIRQAQKIITNDVRGTDKRRGEYRQGDVWIGDLGTTKEEARYIAPDASHVPMLVEQLIAFSKSIGKVNPLIACAVIHHRFEAIHPFEDGNGRTGRLLITLFLISKGMLNMPILYPSGYFEKNKKQYMNNLSNVDENEDWKPWIMFFLKGLESQANLSLKLGLEINNLFKLSRKKVENERANLQLIRVFEHTFKNPYFTGPLVSEELKIPKATCNRYLKMLEENKLIEFVRDQNNVHVYRNKELLNVLRRI